MNERKDVVGKKNDIFYIHLLRIIAVLCVIFIHTNDQGFMLFTLCTPGTFSFWVYMLMAIIAKSSVSLFFMISGALLISKEETISYVWKKRISRFFLLLMIISIFYCLEENIVNDMGYTFETFLKKIYSSKLKYHLWYLYTYLAFLIILPLLRSFVKGMKNSYFYYLFGICLSLKVIYFIELFLNNGEISINHDFRLGWLLTNIFLLPLVGYFIHNRLDIACIKRKSTFFMIPIILLVSLLCIMIATYHDGMMIGEFSEAKSQNHLEQLNFVIAGIFFIIARVFWENTNFIGQIKKLIKSVSNCTLGMYLLHPALRDTYVFEKVYSILHRFFISRIVTVSGYIFVLAIVSYLITLILKKIPFIGKII